MKDKFNLFTFIMCIFVSFTFASCESQQTSSVLKTKIDGKYKQLSDTGRLTSSNIIKEYRQGKFIEYVEDDLQKVTQYKGTYIVTNDSVYVETVEYDYFKKFEGQVILFNYEFKGDTMIQSGEAQYKREIKNPAGSLNKNRTFTQRIPIKMYWLRVEK